VRFITFETLGTGVRASLFQVLHLNAAQIGMRCGDKKAGSLTYSILSDNWYVIVLPASTVRVAAETYLQWLTAKNLHTAADTRGRLEKHFLPKLVTGS